LAKYYPISTIFGSRLAYTWKFATKVYMFTHHACLLCWNRPCKNYDPLTCVYVHCNANILSTGQRTAHRSTQRDHSSLEIDDTSNDLRTEKITSVTIISSLQNVWNVTCEFFYVMKLREKVGVILRCTLATSNEYILTVVIASLFEIPSAIFLPNITWIGLHLEKLS